MKNLKKKIPKKHGVHLYLASFRQHIGEPEYS